MTDLVSQEWWKEAVSLKDTMSIRDIATRFSTTPGALAATLRRTNTTRKPTLAVPEEEVVRIGAPLDEGDGRGRRPITFPTTGQSVWEVTLRSRQGDTVGYLIADSATDAATRAETLGTVIGLSRIGDVIG